MTSKIKVDNIENQCGGSDRYKHHGGTTTISGTVVLSNTDSKDQTLILLSVRSGSADYIRCKLVVHYCFSESVQHRSGFGRTGTVNWQTTVKTARFYSAANQVNGYFV